jgi:CBS domain-containing protein
MPDFSKLSVGQYMNSPVLRVAPGHSLSIVYAQLQAKKVSSLAVMEGEKLLGVISRTDLLREGRVSAHTPGKPVDARRVLLEFSSKTASDVMTPDPVIVGRDTSVAEAGRTMAERAVHRVFVGGSEQVEGVFSTLDIMSAVRDAGSTETIDKNMSSPVIDVDVEESVAAAADRLEHAQISGLIAVENDWPIGVFTQVEALAARDLPDTTKVDDVMDPALICMPVKTQMHRAAQQGLRMRVRRIVASENRHMRGVLSGLDFADFVGRA